MAESTLSLTFDELMSATGLYLGYGQGDKAGDKAWTTRQEALLKTFVKSGLRQFYFPPPIDRSGVSYEWSFLRMPATLVLPEGDNSFDLPDDFGGFDGRLQVEPIDTEIGLEVALVPIGKVRKLRSELSTATGHPMYACPDPKKGTTGTRGQRFTLEVYPTANQDYNLLCSYHVHPDALDGSRPYAYGGVVHSETIKASIKAIAERELDNIKEGPEYGFFMQRLATSISQDRKLKPMELGFNGDQSNRLYSRTGRMEQRFRGQVTVYGVLPS